MADQGPKTGIIYCRVSSKEQVDNTSLESQERYCREYAIKNNIEVLKVFVEKGESAKTADRTEFKNAIQFCSNKKHGVNTFIVYKLDRFARNQEDHVVVRALLKKVGTELRSATEAISDEPIGRALEGMLSVFAEFDNNTRTQRTKDGMLERLKQGFWPWRAPIGYYRATKGSNIAPEPSTAPYIRLAFEEYTKSKPSYVKLAQFLNERGFTSNGKQLYPQHIEKILKNPIYYGAMNVWGEYKGAFDPIVSEELFNQCQVGYRSRNKFENRKTNNPAFPLRRFICTQCNKPMTGSYSTGKSGGRYPYYHHQKHGVCPNEKYIPKKVFEESFVEYLKEISPSVKYEKAFRVVMIDIWQSNYKKFDEISGSTRRELERLELERQKIFNLHRAGTYDDDEFEEQKRITNQQIHAKHLLLQENHIEEFNMEEALDYCFRFVRDSAKTWERLPYESKLKFQNQVFEEKPQFDGSKFGTPKLSPVYAISEQYDGKKSDLVALARVELAFSR